MVEGIETQVRNLNICDNITHSLDSSFYIVAGNHDQTNTTLFKYDIDSIKTRWSYPPQGTTGSDTCWYFQKGRWAVIGMFPSFISHQVGTRDVNLDSVSKYVKLNIDKHCILISHYRFGLTSVIANKQALLDSLALWSNVKLCLSGHVHKELYYENHGIPNYVLGTLTVDRIVRFTCYTDGTFDVEWIQP